MSPARDHRAPAENWPTPHKTPKVPWPRITVDSNAPAIRWTDRAACVGDWDLFDAPDHGVTDRERADQLAIARAICATCPVMAECDEFARTATPRVSGIWAGRRRHPASSKERSTTP